jgi:KDO2-lipid IV(A) lauroyltransferase
MLFLRALAWIVARLPWSWLPPLGAVIGFFAGDLLRVRRAHVVASMRTGEIPEPERQASRMYRQLGTGALEVLWSAGRARTPRHVELSPRARALFQEAEERGRGVVIAASHTGNWELAAFAMAERGPLHVVAKTQGVAAFDAFCKELRARRGLELSAPDGALARAKAALRRGSKVVMMLDQAPARRRHGVVVDFMGRPAFVERAPAALAAEAGAALFVAAARREGDRHVLEVLDVVVPPQRPGPSWIDASTRAATEALERFVRREPAGWLWMHRRWKVPAS